MKALAGRPQDVKDLELLRIVIGITTADEALRILTRYIPERLLSPRVTYLVEGLFDES